MPIQNIVGGVLRCLAGFFFFFFLKTEKNSLAQTFNTFGVDSWWLPTTEVALVSSNGGFGVWLGVDVPAVFEADGFLTFFKLIFIMANSSTSDSMRCRRGVEVARVVHWWWWW